MMINDFCYYLNDFWSSTIEKYTNFALEKNKT